MSKEDAKAFIEKVKNDPELRKEVNGHIIKVAGDHGHKVSHSDLKAALQEHWRNQGNEDEAAIVLSEAPGF